MTTINKDFKYDQFPNEISEFQITTYAIRGQICITYHCPSASNIHIKSAFYVQKNTFSVVLQSLILSSIKILFTTDQINCYFFSNNSTHYRTINTAEKHVTSNRKFQVTPYGKDMYFFDIFINNGRICIGFVADHSEKVQNRTHLNGFLEKRNHLKVIEDQLVFLAFSRQ